MAFFENWWHVLSAFFIFCAGLFLISYIAPHFKIRSSKAIILYIWHTIFCIVYALYASGGGSDALTYYIRADSQPELFRFGTVAIVWFTYIFREIDLSFLGVSLVHNIIGSVGLLAFYASLLSSLTPNSNRISKLSSIIVFLPSISFWSSAVGKDAIAFMAIALALWAAINLRYRKKLMVFAILAMLFVRPHMAGLMVIALCLAVLFQRDIPALQRLIVGLVALVAVAIMVPFALNYAGVGENASIAELQQFVEKRQSYNTDGGGGVDIASMPLPLQLFTYLFRPLFFDAHSIPSLASSIDNFILFLLVTSGVVAQFKTKKLSLPGSRYFMWCYVFIAWLTLSVTTANLGISVRQKWMFTPILIYLLISLLAAREERVKNTHE